MGVHKAPRTMPGDLTPICNECGVYLCWDISEEEYLTRREFWDEWRCKECCPGSKDSLS